MTDTTPTAGAPAADQATGTVEKAVDAGAAAAENTVEKAAAAVESVVAAAAKDADTLIAEVKDHIGHFVEKNLPTLEAQGHDFAGSLGTKLKSWLADAEQYLASKAPAASK